MAIIFSYPVKSTANNNDLILISDSQDSNQTKQIKVSSIVDQSLSLTTTGTTGLATLIDNVLNIPNYSIVNPISFSGTTPTGLVTRGVSATQASVSSTIKSFGNSIFFNAGSNTGIQHDASQTFKIGDTGGAGDALAFYTKSFQRLRITSQGAFVLGAGTTNYGTIGQALVSQGDNVPTWQTMPSKIFSTIKVSGQTDVVATSTDDNLTLVAGANITLLTNPSLRTVTISSTGGGGGGGGDTYTLQAEAKSGESVPLKLDAASGTDSTVNLTEGTGVSLTRNSANEITINTTNTLTAGSGVQIGSGTIQTDNLANGGIIYSGASNELAVDVGASALTGTLAIARGGTGLSLSATTTYNALMGDGGNSFSESGNVDTALKLPVGNTSRRPNATADNVGLIRYNSATANFEVCKQTTSSSGEYSWYTIDLTIISG